MIYKCLNCNDSYDNSEMEFVPDENNDNLYIKFTCLSRTVEEEEIDGCGSVMIVPLEDLDARQASQAKDLAVLVRDRLDNSSDTELNTIINNHSTSPTNPSTTQGKIDLVKELYNI